MRDEGKGFGSGSGVGKLGDRVSLLDKGIAGQWHDWVVHRQGFCGRERTQDQGVDEAVTGL